MRTFFFLSIFFLSNLTWAATLRSLPEAKARLDLSRVVSTTTLSTDSEKDISIRAVVMDLGKSTDLAPRRQLYITYFHAAEINNTRTAFDLGPIENLKSTKRLGNGLFELQVYRFGDSGPQNLKIVIDARNVLLDDERIQAKDFTDPYFESTLIVTNK